MIRFKALIASNATRATRSQGLGMRMFPLLCNSWLIQSSDACRRSTSDRAKKALYRSEEPISLGGYITTGSLQERYENWNITYHTLFASAEVSRHGIPPIKAIVTVTVVSVKGFTCFYTALCYIFGPLRKLIVLANLKSGGGMPLK